MANAIGLHRLQFDCLQFALFALHKNFLAQIQCATIYGSDLRANISNAMINSEQQQQKKKIAK